MSAYECERERNIAANQAVLRSLGLHEPPLPPKSVRSQKKRSRAVRDEKPARRSSRVAATPGEQTKPIPVPRPPPWEREVFAECERGSKPPGPAASWDARRCHQHLSISSSARSVATTGVAGYGVVVAARGTVQRWRVLAVRFGVGGFGVGVVRAGWKGPYKSLGSTAECVGGSYLSSGVLSCQGIERAYGPAYDEGDVIEVVLRGRGKARELIFCRNGSELGVAARGIGEGPLLLACQPYMGGVACLV